MILTASWHSVRVICFIGLDSALLLVWHRGRFLAEVRVKEHQGLLARRVVIATMLLVDDLLGTAVQIFQGIAFFDLIFKMSLLLQRLQDKVREGGAVDLSGLLLLVLK